MASNGKLRGITQKGDNPLKTTKQRKISLYNYIVVYFFLPFLVKKPGVEMTMVID